MKDDWIKDEYLHLQELIQTFDQKALTIKAWSATISMAGVGIAYEQAEPSLLLISSVGALLFWLIEWRWKVFQSAHYGRIEEIEASMREAESSTRPFQIYAGWWTTYKSDGRLKVSVLVKPHVYLPHAVIVFGGIALYLLLPPG